MKIQDGDIKYFWLRDSEHNRVAVVAWVVTEVIYEPTEMVSLQYAVATRNPIDPFSGVIARAVAAGRLRNAKEITSLGIFDYGHMKTIRAQVMLDKALPQSARDAARLWLNSWPEVDRRKANSNRRQGERREP